MSSEALENAIIRLILKELLGKLKVMYHISSVWGYLIMSTTIIRVGD